MNSEKENIMNRKIKFISMIIVALVTVCFTCGCNNNLERKVTIAYNPNAYASSISQIMINNNLLEKYLPDNCNVEWVEMSSASDIRDALASGSIDIATPALTSYISAYENNMPIDLISNYGSAQVYCYAVNGIDRIDNFDIDDSIAVKGLNTNPHIAFLAYCKENALDIDKYNKMLTKIPETETLALLETSDQISGAILSYPVNKKADEIKNCKMIADFSDTIKEYNLGTVVCVNKSFNESNKDIVEGFEKAHKYIVDSWQTDLDFYASILSKQYSCSKEEIKSVMIDMPPTLEITGYDKLANLMYEAKMLNAKPTPFNDVSK
jgi:ABC-type nitrate/sulfonate/bicarbonate transport system substrate-binding protein